jgi:hypothetical protein
MKIENRVEALELELKILKNEIQSTLLEIREQVLNHYYPELRAEEPGRAPKREESRPAKGGPAKGNSTPRIQTASLSPAAAKGPVLPFSDISLQDLGVDDDDLEDDEFGDDDFGGDNSDDYSSDDEEEDDLPAVRAIPVATPKTREVALDQIKQAPPAAKAKVNNIQANGAQGKSEPQGQKTNRRTFAALAAWVGDSVAKVGKERTVQVVETYAASGGSLSKETKASLLQLASLASDEEPAGPVGNQEMLALMVELDQILSEQ